MLTSIKINNQSSSVPSDSDECLLISAKWEIFENFYWNLEHLFGEIQWNKFVCDVVHGTKNELGNDVTSLYNNL